MSQPKLLYSGKEKLFLKNKHYKLNINKMSKSKSKIRVGIIGLGNCAKSLVEGVSITAKKLVQMEL